MLRACKINSNILNIYYEIIKKKKKNEYKGNCLKAMWYSCAHMNQHDVIWNELLESNFLRILSFICLCCQRK